MSLGDKIFIKIFAFFFSIDFSSPPLVMSYARFLWEFINETRIYKMVHDFSLKTFCCLSNESSQKSFKTSERSKKAFQKAILYLSSKQDQGKLFNEILFIKKKTKAFCCSFSLFCILIDSEIDENFDWLAYKFKFKTHFALKAADFFNLIINWLSLILSWNLIWICKHRRWSRNLTVSITHILNKVN